MSNSFFSKHESDSYTQQALAVSDELRDTLQAWFAKHQGEYSIRVLEYLATSQIRETAMQVLATARINAKYPYRIFTNEAKPDFESSSLAEAIPAYEGLLRSGAKVRLQQGSRVLIRGEELGNTTETEKALIQTWFRDQMGLNVHG
jgi:hypothetical protein